MKESNGDDASLLLNLKTLAERLLETPPEAPVDERLARDLARAALAAHEGEASADQQLSNLVNEWFVGVGDLVSVTTRGGYRGTGRLAWVDDESGKAGVWIDGVTSDEPAVFDWDDIKPGRWRVMHRESPGSAVRCVGEFGWPIAAQTVREENKLAADGERFWLVVASNSDAGS